MTAYLVTVTREVPVEAPDPRTAEQWALEAEHLHDPVIVEVLPVNPSPKLYDGLRRLRVN